MYPWYGRCWVLITDSFDEIFRRSKKIEFSTDEEEIKAKQKREKKVKKTDEFICKSIVCINLVI